MIVALTKAQLTKMLTPAEMVLMTKWFLEAYSDGTRPPEMIDYEAPAEALYTKLMDANLDRMEWG